jgi:cephalosporin-C deacetylase
MNRFLTFALLFFSISIFSQNLLDNQWQFKTGDSLVWKETSYNSSKWGTIKSGIIWENQGFPGYDGYAWYRKSVVIPIEFKNEIVKNGGVSLNLGAIDDNDQTFFNGKLIGESGQMPPHFQTAYDKIRKYDIASNDINWGKENIIAVRVYDHGGGGGMTGPDVSLKIGELGSNIKIRHQFLSENHIFLNSQNVSFNFVVDNATPLTFDGKLEYCLINDFKDTILVSNENLKLTKKSNKTITYKNSKLVPGFYTMSVQLKSKLLNASQELKFGVEPEKIVSKTDRASDFDNFWMRAKRELAAVDPQFKLIHKDSLSTDKRDVYLVEMRSLDNVLIRGWYARPKAPGKFPAILHVQGYSSNAEMSWGYKGDDMAVFVLNIRGHGNSRDEINPGFPGFLEYNLKDRERYIYRGAYMDCIRAVDFLFSRDEVDTNYVVVEGGSQGGALSFATAALDNKRIKLCMPSVPFLSDFKNYFKVASWPGNEFVEFEKKNHDFGWKKIYENLSYFDIKNLAPWVRCPVFMIIGLKDTTCPPRINFAAYNQLNVPKSYFVFPESGHGLPNESLIMKYDWMKKELTKLKASTK